MAGQEKWITKVNTTLINKLHACTILILQVFDEGITNKLVGGYRGASFAQARDVVLIRVYGEKTDLIIDRNAEKQNMSELAEAGMCPPVYATFDNGLVYEFAPGVTLDEKTVRDETIRK